MPIVFEYSTMHNYKYMKHHLITLVLAILLGSLAIFVLFLVQESRTPEPIGCTMEAKICPDGSAVGRSGPNCEFAPCPELLPVADDIQAHIDSKADLIVVDTPLRDATVTSPLTITGKARGTWYFEASFPIVVVDWDGLIIGEGHADAQGDWMTEDFVPFTATVSFTVATDTPYRRGAVILQKDNPSGLPEHDDALEIPIVLE